MKHDYSLQQVRRAVKTSKSIRQALKKLGVVPRGGNYGVLRRLCKKHDISCEHFTGQGHNKGNHQPKRPIECYTQHGVPINSFRLKNRLLREGYFTHRCNKCKGTKWLGNPIPLELDHRNGDSEDNRLENLELLCPNCHAFTPTYRGRKKKSSK